MEVTFLWGKYLTSDAEGERFGEYRFDADPSKATLLRDGTGQKSGFLPWDRVAEFTRSALLAKQVIFRVTDSSDGERVTATFSLTGLGAALKRLPCNKS